MGPQQIRTGDKIALILDQYNNILSKNPPLIEKTGPTIPVFYQTKNLSIIGHSAKEAIIEEIRRLKSEEVLTNDELDMVWNELAAHANKNEDGEKVATFTTKDRLLLIALLKH
jgi:hypothetical protein